MLFDAAEDAPGPTAVLDSPPEDALIPNAVL
jgi:hypothetical protein